MKIKKLIIIALFIGASLAVQGCETPKERTERLHVPASEMVPYGAENVVELLPEMIMYEIHGKCFIIDNRFYEPTLKNCDKYK